jgi:glycosidase
MTMMSATGLESAVAQQNDKLMIYQLLPRLFGNTKSQNVPFGTIEQNGSGKFNDINQKAIDGIKELGITHVWYTGVIAHASLTDYSKYGIPAADADVVKGRAGSPYAIRDYYDVDPDLAIDVKNRMAEFEALLERTHKNGLKVIIDFVPNHVARSYESKAKPAKVIDFGAQDDKTVAFHPRNDYYYVPGKDFVAPVDTNINDGLASLKDGRFPESPAKATGNNVFSEAPSKNDWYETVKLNYGVDYQNNNQTHFDPIPPVWTKMRDILVYWSNKGVDGFRCDVAEMVPVEFWNWVIPELKKVKPSLVFIGEAYDPTAYETYLTKGKFDYLYDKVGLYDGLKRLMRNEEQAKTADIDHVWQVESATFGNKMLRFLENHDEERIASKAFAANPWLAVPAMVVSATLSGGPVMLYSGQEVGEKAEGVSGFSGDDGRTTIFDYWGVPALQQWVNNGKYDGALLSDEQKALRAFYSKLFHIAGQSDAIISGKHYNLPLENNSRAYAYFRYTAKERMLVVVNFDREQTFERALNIPAEVLSGATAAAAKDLLNNSEVQINGQSIRVKVAPSAAQIIKF